MLHMQSEEEHQVTVTDGSAVLRTGGGFGRRRPRAARVVPFILLVAILAACAPGEAPPPEICDTYDRALFTTQLMGGAAVILGLAVLGFKKNLSAILPSQGAQIGAIAGSVGLGLILLAFSTDIGNQILTGFGIESLYTLCGLG
ncbi:MAG: hypothetical protein HF973_06815 [Chloroflexi bacterium]|nr:hypothetical protein [Chloroflexota bacterium]